MVFDIYKFRYINEKTYVESVATYEAACKRIDELATEYRKSKKWYHIGDPLYYTFMPRGVADGYVVG